MANTYTLINSITVGSPVASMSFSSIPATYTDLLLKMSVRNSAGSNAWDDFYIDINGSSSNFTSRVLYGGGGGGTSVGSSSYTFGYAQIGEGNGGTTNTFGNAEMYFPNYTDSTTAKSFSSDSVSENNAAGNLVQIGATLWNPSTKAAISSLTFRWVTTGNFVANSTAYLYGIKNS